MRPDDWRWYETIGLLLWVPVVLVLAGIARCRRG